MTVEYIADQAILMVSGGRATVEGLDKREVIAMVEEAIPMVAQKEYWDNYKAINQNQVQSQWLVPLQITLTNNTMLNLKQAILPEAYMNFPKDRGVYKVQANGNIWAKMDYNTFEMLRGGAFLGFVNKPSYALLANTVLALPVCNEPIRTPSIVVTLALANDATLTESYGLLIFERIIPLLRIRMGMPADMITDQNPNVK